MAEMKTPLEAGEQLVHDGRANLQRGAETVGGHAYLTDHRLIFEPHRLNAQRDVEVVPTASVTGVQTGFTKFLGFIPLVPNAVIVELGNETLRLTVGGRKSWVHHLREAAGLAANA